MNIHNPHFLWITPVEKYVENVENYELSTDIPVLWKFCAACGNLCMPLCIIRRLRWERLRYVTIALGTVVGKFAGKSLQSVKNLCHNLSRFETSHEIFVKNIQRAEAGIFFPQPGNTGSSEGSALQPVR